MLKAHQCKRMNKTHWLEISTEVFHLILCEEITQLQAKKTTFFQFWGHNVPLNCTELLIVRRRNIAHEYNFHRGITHVCTGKIDKVMKKDKI